MERNSSAEEKKLPNILQARSAGDVQTQDLLLFDATMCATM